MLYLANWFNSALGSITLEHTSVAVYLLVVTLAFLLLPSCWTRRREDIPTVPTVQQHKSGVSRGRRQKQSHHRKSAPSITTLRTKDQSETDTKEEAAYCKQETRLEGDPLKEAQTKRYTEFDFYEIREKFKKMQVESDQPFPDPPPMLTADEIRADGLGKTLDLDVPAAAGKGERMFELRRIQFGDRAVSSGETAQQLEQFFTRDQDQTIRAPRSEGVRADLEELARNRSVGNLLSTRFRVLLENSLSAPPQTPARVIAPRGTPSSRSAQGLPPQPQPPPAPQLPGTESTGVRLERQSAAAVDQAAIRAAEEYVPPDFSDRQFDYAISDVEELFQRRLVSDVLHSAFRNVLELHIERRLVRAGVAPRQNRPPPPQQPGAAGIQPAPPNMAPIVQPSSSRRIPEIERQVHVMSIELKEMKGMLKLLVDTQLDMQRSIRQEVNAMMRSSTVEPAKPTKQIKEGTCVVCLEFPCDTVLYRCGHLCCCFSCARSLRVAGHHCPVCRAEVADILRIYRSTNDGNNT